LLETLYILYNDFGFTVLGDDERLTFVAQMADDLCCVAFR
jgi:hypothetical protein